MSILGIFTAMTTVLTLSVRIPIGLGYLNFGDAVVLISGLLFGPWVGAFAGGIGSMLADLIGYPEFAPLTLIAKGLEGFLVGILANPRRRQNRVEWQDFLGVGVGGMEMVGTYFLGEVFFYGGMGYALSELPGNAILQFGGGAIISLALVTALRKVLLENYPIIRTTFFPRSQNIERGSPPHATHSS